MGKRLSQEEILNKLISYKGIDNYDYSKVSYINSKTPVSIICKKHNKEFTILVNQFIHGLIGCPVCRKESYFKKRSHSNIISMFKEKYGDKYDYSKVDYKGIDTPVTLICKKHGEFKKSPWEFLHSSECIKCVNKKSFPRHSNKDIIDKLKSIYGNKYDYSKVSYKSVFDNITLICKEHGEFTNSYYNLIYFKKGCIICENRLHQISFEEFIARVGARSNKFIYKNYLNISSRVSIYCKEHDLWFSQYAYAHLRGEGCPLCKTSSKGEKIISEKLQEQGIEFESQKTFTDLKFQRPLKYDFYIPSTNTLIEYNGIQHYKWVKHFHKSYHDWLVSKHRDWLKRKYAKDNGFNYIIVPYWEEI